MEARIGWRRALDVLLGKKLYCLVLAAVVCIVVTAYREMLLPGAYEKALLIWAAAVLLWDVLHQRACLKTEGSVWLLAFCVAAVLNVLLSGGNRDLTLLALCVNVILMFLCYSAASGDTTGNFLRAFNAVAVIAGIVVAVLSLVKAITGDNAPVFNWPQGMTGGAFFGMTINPNSLGQLALIAVFGAAWNLLAAWRRQARLCAAGYAACILFMLFVLGATVSRASMLACQVAAGLSVYFFMQRVWKARWKSRLARAGVALLSALAVICAMQLIFEASADAFEHMLPEGTYYKRKAGMTEMVRSMIESGERAEAKAVTPAEAPGRTRRIAQTALPPQKAWEQAEQQLNASSSARWQIWKNGIQEWRKAPILGVGHGNSGSENNTPRVQDLHNSYLIVLVSNGVVGFLLFLGFGIQVFGKSLFCLLRSQKEATGEIARTILLFSILCGLCVYGFVETAILYDLRLVMVYIWVWLGAYTQCIPPSGRGKMDVDRYFVRAWNRLLPKHHIEEGAL